MYFAFLLAWSLPVWKGLTEGLPRGYDQLPHQLPPSQKLLQHLSQRFGLKIVPLAGNLLRNLVQCFLRNFRFDASKRHGSNDSMPLTESYTTCLV